MCINIRRNQTPLALAGPLAWFASRVGIGSAIYFKCHAEYSDNLFINGARHRLRIKEPIAGIRRNCEEQG